jgi:arabinogalactan endo-1,4-beta-galactosidase
MKEYGVEYKIICFSFYPTGIGASFDLLQKLGEISKDEEKIIYIAEYTYPSSQPKDSFGL